MLEILSVENGLVVAWMAGFVFACFAFTVGDLVHLLCMYLKHKLKEE